MGLADIQLLSSECLGPVVAGAMQQSSVLQGTSMSNVVNACALQALIESDCNLL